MMLLMDYLASLKHISGFGLPCIADSDVAFQVLIVG